jgi:transposase
MGRPLNTIDKTYPKDALDMLYKSEANVYIKERLLAIIHLYEGKSPNEVAELLKRGGTTIREWRNRWNKEGYRGLKPNSTGGPRPKLLATQWDEVAEYVKGKGMTLHDVRNYIEDHYKVVYTYEMVWIELREKRKIRYGKAFKINKKMPDDAAVQLKKNRCIY